jgi:undecaprenyl-diphosphatase
MVGRHTDRETMALVAGFVSAAAALVLFAWLATQVFRNSAIFFDAAAREWLHGYASPGLTAFFRTVTVFGSEWLLVPSGTLVVWRLAAADRKRAAVLFTIAVAGGEALDYSLKLLFRRERPEVFFGYIAPNTYSFPSGHAMLAVCFYGALAAILASRLQPSGRAAVWAAAAAAALLIGASRVYLGVHYPSDVVAGYAAAVVWVFAIGAAHRARLRRAARGTAARGQSPSETLPSSSRETRA